MIVKVFEQNAETPFLRGMGLGVSNASKVRPGGRLSLDGCGCPKSWLFLRTSQKNDP